jgi:hypothetical protein
LVAGATPKRLPTSKVAVSIWHIPGGYDYSRAEARMWYFEDVEAAEKFATWFAMPPEMAMVVPLDKVKA